LRPILPGAWWLGVGVSFSFLGGTISRAPAWMQRSGLEWLHRLSREPRRLAHRYLIDDAPFAAWMLLRAACGKARDHA
jgi:N-acetylglucosaminyldiphosphoundecaprenol N-acetyl-beta-D-mannosaminyltransferase